MLSIQRIKILIDEDSDLLKTAARQVAAFLEQMNAAKALAEAKQFESVVTSSKDTTWGSPEVCERYVDRLLQAAEQLTNKNRKLNGI